MFLSINFDFNKKILKINLVINFITIMKFEVQTWVNNKILRTPSEEIRIDEIKKYISLWEDMIKFIKNPVNNWVWLAAPQLGISKRLICVSLLKTYEDSSFKTILMINPQILYHSEDQDIDTEWCLSVPRKFWDVLRYKNIKVKFLDNKWKETILFLDWIASRIVQHEIDHLEWILFTDKVIKKEEEILENHTF